MTNKTKSLHMLIRLALAGTKDYSDKTQQSQKTPRVVFPQRLRRKIIEEAPPNFFTDFSEKQYRAFLIKLLGDDIGVTAIKALQSVSEERINNTINWANEAKNHLLFIHDENYPQRLKELIDAPILIYAKGNLNLLKTPSLAIVGSRSCTAYGERLANEYADQLSAGGITIVSGLAMGIDHAAHSGAIANESFATIGVLGTGANIIYPHKNTKIARQMAEQALIITEFHLDTAPRPFNFPKRNRIIAALSLGCLVIEASEKSGALITARQAAEIGIEVFAIPGSVHSPLSRGPHRLIREGAKLVESTRDIFEELHSQLIPFLSSMSKAEKIIKKEDVVDIPENNILDFIPYSPTLLDDIVDKSGVAIVDIHSQLLNLEMAGIIESLAGGRFQRIK